MLRKILFYCLAVCFLLPLSAQEAQKREMRTVWIATVANIDWPQIKGTGADVIAKQKKQLTDVLDGFVNTNMNSVCLQVRPMADALYKSSYEPWSRYISGTRGVDPGWDPLAFAVEECHKRGLELNVWLNPYRFSNSGGNDNTTPQDEELKNSGTLMTVGQSVVFNPALESSRRRLLNVCKELIQNYEIDGIIFDDYFYPGGGTPTDNTAPDYQLWKDAHSGLSIADWRRANVNLMVKEVYNLVQATKPYVKFSIGPAGVAGTAATSASQHHVDPCPVGSDWQYSTIYSDPLAWLEEGTIDYISPQLYWKTTHATNPFGPLTQWWSYVANHFGRHHYASHNIYFMQSTNSPLDWAEIASQISLSRQYNLDNAPGVNFYSAKYINGPTCAGLGEYLRQNLFTHKALEPALTWKPKTNFDAPAGATLQGGVLSWTGVNKSLVRYSVYAIPASVGIDEAKSAKFGGIKSDYLLDVTYKPTFTIPGAYLNGYYYAVCVVDGWNNEFAPVYVNAPAGEAEQVTLISPTGGAVTQWVQPFKWTAAAGATYRLQIARDSGFSAVVLDTAAIAENEVTLDLGQLESNQAYYWRISTSQPAHYDKLSESATFTTPVKTSAPVTALIAPARGTLTETDFVFRCSKVDVDGYRLQVSKSQDFSSITFETSSLVEENGVMTCHYNIALGGKGTFYWRVITTARYHHDAVSDVWNYTVTKTPVGDLEPGYVVKKDIDTYSDVNRMRLTNLWVRSIKPHYDNITFLDAGKLNRGFAVKDGVIYVAGRETGSSSSPTYLKEYNAETGEHIKDLPLGADASVSYLPCNDVLTDDAGHVVVTNLLLNVTNTPLDLFQVNTETGEVVLRASLTATGLAKPRIDHCGLTGDVEQGNFTVFASTSYGTQLIRWTVVDGQLVETKVVDLQAFSPESAQNVGIASRVIPVDENTVYVNGGGTYFTRYDFLTGAITGSFPELSELCPVGKNNNGGAVFSLNGKNYMLYPYSDEEQVNGFRFMLAENATGTDFSGYSKMWAFPEQGLGSVNSNTWSTPCVTVPAPNGRSQLLYLYVPGNGLAAYQFGPSHLRGDVNLDGVVDVVDVTKAINMILGNVPVDLDAADMNGDGTINVSDITGIINVILQPRP